MFGIVAGCGVDLLWAHRARDVAHLLVDVIVSRTTGERLKLNAQIDHRLTFEPGRAGLGAHLAVACAAWRDPTQRRTAGDDARRVVRAAVGEPGQIGVI